MGLSKRNVITNKKPVIVKEEERCEMRQSAANLPTHRCDDRGELYSVNGTLARGFARLCKRHVGVLERQGYTVTAINPIEDAARTAQAL